MAIKFVMDVGSNHNRDQARMAALIEGAAAIGADAVKVQLFTQDLYASAFLEQRARLNAWRLPPAWIPGIKAKCVEVGVEFHCTPFNLAAVDALAPHVDALKIGSHEVLWTDLIQKCARARKPLGISCGFANQNDIWTVLMTIAMEVKSWSLKRTLNFMKHLTLYQCNPTYPALSGEANLEEITWMVEQFAPATIGYSDHTTEPGAIYAAMAKGARAVEIHIDLDDMQGWESLASTPNHVWPMTKAGQMITTARVMEQAWTTDEDAEWTEEAKWMTDPADGMRPLTSYREDLAP